MAKASFIMFGSRGRVGNVIGYSRDGKKLMRSTPASVKNPQTQNQMIQRICFATASKMAQHIRGIVDHSFQGVKYGQTSVNHFTSKLAKELQSYVKSALAGSSSELPFKNAPILPLSAAGIGCGAAALVSSGDLKAMPFQLSDDNNGGLLVGNAGGVTISTGLSVTVADYESVFGVPASDQVTIIEGYPVKLDYISEDQLFEGVRFDFLRWNIKADADPAATLFVAGTQSGDLLLNPAILDMERTDPRVLNLIFVVVNDEQLGIVTGSSETDAGNVFGTGLAKDVCLAAVIVSRYENNAWRRSTSRLVRTPLYTPTSGIQIQDYWGFNDIEDVLALTTTKSISESEYLNKKKAEGVA